MKKLGKKMKGSQSTIEAYQACNVCNFCYCANPCTDLIGSGGVYSSGNTVKAYNSMQQG